MTGERQVYTHGDSKHEWWMVWDFTKEQTITSVLTRCWRIVLPGSRATAGASMSGERQGSLHKEQMSTAVHTVQGAALQARGCGMQCCKGPTIHTADPSAFSLEHKGAALRPCSHGCQCCQVLPPHNPILYSAGHGARGWKTAHGPRLCRDPCADITAPQSRTGRVRRMHASGPCTAGAAHAPCRPRICRSPTRPCAAL